MHCGGNIPIAITPFAWRKRNAGMETMEIQLSGNVNLAKKEKSFFLPISSASFLLTVEKASMEIK